jgi:radical SAM-linked protein
LPQEIIRFKFFKKNELKYLSHLDMVAMLSRAFIRAGIKAAYSAGFNPKPKLSLSNPIPLGVQSLAEYGDICLSEWVGSSRFIEIVNKQLPANIQLTEAANAPSNTASLMSVIGTVLYEFEIICDDLPPVNKNLANIKSELEKNFQQQLIEKQNLSGQVYSCDFKHTDEVSDSAGLCPTLKLDVIGFTKIFKEKQNSIFKFNDFAAKLKGFLSGQNQKINFMQKKEVYIINDFDKKVLLNPLEIL